MGDRYLEGICNCFSAMLMGIVCCPCIALWGCIVTLYPGYETVSKIVDQVLDRDLLVERDIIMKSSINSWLHLGFSYEDEPQIINNLKNKLTKIIWKQICTTSLNGDISCLDIKSVKFIAKQIRIYLQMTIMSYYEEERLYWNPDKEIDGKKASEHAKQFMNEWKGADIITRM